MELSTREGSARVSVFVFVAVWDTPLLGALCGIGCAKCDLAACGFVCLLCETVGAIIFNERKGKVFLVNLFLLLTISLNQKYLTPRCAPKVIHPNQPNLSVKNSTK